MQKQKEEKEVFVPSGVVPSKERTEEIACGVKDGVLEKEEEKAEEVPKKERRTLSDNPMLFWETDM